MAIGNRTFHAVWRKDIFVGRDAEQDLFRAQCQKLLTTGGGGVLNYYGIGGIGKTALLNRIMRELDGRAQYKKIVVLYHDFANGTDLRDILQAWKGALENLGCEFPYFDLGNFYLLLKEGNADPDKPKIKSRLEKNPWLNRAKDALNKTANLSDAAVPGAVAVTTIAEVTVDALGIIPGIKTVSEIAKALNNYLAANDTQTQLNKNKNLYDELNRRAELRNTDALKNYLPTLFAQDVFDWAGGDKKFVIVLDSCEVLTGGKKLNANNLPCDWWLIGEGGLIRQMPATLWLAASRNKLPWSGAEIISRRLDSLTDDEARALLEKAAVEESLREKFLAAAKGYPLFLVELANKKVIADVHAEIIERILRNLSAVERTMLQRLCALGKWTDEIVRAEKFNPHTYRRFKELAFVQLAEENYFTLDPTLQKILS